MTDEFIDIVDENGKPTGESCPKSEIHSKGHYHNTVHIWFYTNEGEILLQQRSITKPICPLLWDVSVAGHIDAGESIEDAAIRETKEEIGLTIKSSELQKIGVFKCFQKHNNGKIIDNEFHHTFIIELKVELDALIPQPGEVEALRLVTFQDFKEKLKESETNLYFVASNRPYYDFVLKEIMNAV